MLVVEIVSGFSGILFAVVIAVSWHAAASDEV
jgi:hypothetical protein